MAGAGAPVERPRDRIRILCGRVQVAAKAVPFSLDQDEVAGDADKAGVRHLAGGAAVNDEIPGPRLADLGVAVVGQDKLNAAVVDPVAAAGEYPAVTVARRVGAGGADERDRELAAQELFIRAALRGRELAIAAQGEFDGAVEIGVGDERRGRRRVGWKSEARPPPVG